MTSGGSAGGTVGKVVFPGRVEQPGGCSECGCARRLQLGCGRDAAPARLTAVLCPLRGVGRGAHRAGSGEAMAARAEPGTEKLLWGSGTWHSTCPTPVPRLPVPPWEKSFTWEKNAERSFRASFSTGERINLLTRHVRGGYFLLSRRVLSCYSSQVSGQQPLPPWHGCGASRHRSRLSGFASVSLPVAPCPAPQSSPSRAPLQSRSARVVLTAGVRCRPALWAWLRGATAPLAEPAGQRGHGSGGREAGNQPWASPGCSGVGRGALELSPSHAPRTEQPDPRHFCARCSHGAGFRWLRVFYSCVRPVKSLYCPMFRSG